MIQYTTGNLLDANTEAMVNTVNCVGVMGKGIALQFKQAFPENYERYRLACQQGQVVPGRMLVVPTGNLMGARLIINFPTKRHWKDKSRIDDVASGLTALVQTIRENAIRSIAVPPLGCGNGGLSWDAVRQLIERSLGCLSGVEVMVYGHSGTNTETERIRVQLQTQGWTS